MILIKEEDFETKEGRQKITQFLNGIQETIMDLILANQQKLIDMGKAYAKPENINY